jgi:hypothetical protein
MDYLSNDFVYKSQPEIIQDNLIDIIDDKNRNNILTDEQVQNLLENYENKLNKTNNNNIKLLFVIFFILFFLIFYFLSF